MDYINAIGRRKAAVARVYLSEGSGKIVINKREIEQYFPSSILQYIVKQPLLKLDVAAKYDIKINLRGGGFKGQSEAARPCTGQDQSGRQTRFAFRRLHHSRSSRGRT